MAHHGLLIRRKCTPSTTLITQFGLGIVRTALKAGHKVIASSRNPSKTPDLVKEVEQAGGKWIALDVAAPDAKDVVENAIAIHGRLDVLVNNAGYFELGAVEDTS